MNDTAHLISGRSPVLGIAEILLAPPSVTCAECQAAAPRHWFSAVYMYCHHRRFLATRVPAPGEHWRLVKIDPKSLHKRVGRWQSTGTEMLERWTRRAGMTRQELDEELTAAWLKFLETKSPGPARTRG
jgi:hypothetical protein